MKSVVGARDAFLSRCHDHKLTSQIGSERFDHTDLAVVTGGGRDGQRVFVDVQVDSMERDLVGWFHARHGHFHGCLEFPVLFGWPSAGLRTHVRFESEIV